MAGQTEAIMSSCTVVIADGHPLFLDALGATIGACSDIDLVGTAATAGEAVTTIEQTRPDVAVLDLELPGQHGPEIAAQLAARSPRTRVVFLSASRDGATVYDALAAGAVGYLSKEEPACAIRDAILHAASGRRFLAPSLQSSLLEEIGVRADRTRCHLTDRERAVLDLAADGYTVARMGQSLHLSSATIKVHLSTLYAKLGAHDRATAVVCAVRQGLIA